MKTPSLHRIINTRAAVAVLGQGVLLAWMALAAFAPAARAATGTPPEAMTYQGYLVDANGVPLANTAPQNYPIAFRIYNTTTPGITALWAEQQIVTVDKGNFSVLLGEGTQIGGEARPPLSSIFRDANASDRYISAWVTIGANTVEILPRSRLVPSPYAFLATSAASLIQPNGSPFLSYAGGQVNITGGNVGIGASAPGRRLQIGDATVANSEGMIRLASRSGAGGATRTWDIGVPEADESVVGTSYSFIVDDTQRAGTEFMVQFGSGNVGINTINPTARLEINTPIIGDGVNLWGAGPAYYLSDGNKTQRGSWSLAGGAGQYSTDAAANDVVLRTDSLSKLLLQTGSGASGIAIRNNQVGIGTATPGFPLNFASVVGDKISLYGNAGGHYGFGVQGSTLQIHSDVAGSDIVFGYGSSSALTERMRIRGNGNVGIGNSTPNALLHLGSFGGAGDIFFRMESIGGNQFANGFKLRHFSDDHGFDIINEERNGVGLQANGLHFTRHNADAVGQTSLFLSKYNNFVGVGTTAPADHLHVRGGAIRFDDGGNNFVQLTRSGVGMIITANNTTFGVSRQIQWDGDNNWDSLSDRRLKKDIADAEPALDRVMQLQVRRFHWNEMPADAPKKFGLIAQEVEPLFPDAVGRMTQTGTSNEFMTVKYDAFGLIATKALQELKREKDTEQAALKKEIADLKAEVASLKGQLAQAAQQDEVTGLKQLVQQLVKADANRQQAGAVQKRPAAEAAPAASVR